MSEKKELVRAITQRFLPATGAVYLGSLAAAAIANPGALSWVSLGVAGASIASITAGFGTAAVLLRSALRPAVRLSRRSLVAGFTAPLATGVLSAFTQGASDASIAVLTFSAGAITGFVILGSGVLKRRQPEPLDPEVQAELERLEAELLVELPVVYGRHAVRPSAEQLHPAEPRART